MKEKLRVTQLFSGIGFQLRGFENAGVYDVIPVQTCEMDLNAIQSYAAIHCGMTMEMLENYEYPSREEMADYLTKLNIGYDFKKKKPYNWAKQAKKKKLGDLEKTWLGCKLSNNLGDICFVNDIEETDMLTWSFPCQSISVAGKRDGIVKGETRSGLAYEVIRILKNTEHLPKYLLMENVAALLSKQTLPAYLDLNRELDEIGYNCYYQVLSADECNIPQSRDRVFGLYVRKDVDNGKFTFPLPFECPTCVEDYLDPEEEWGEFIYDTPKARTFLENLIMEGKVS